MRISLLALLALAVPPTAFAQSPPVQRALHPTAAGGGDHNGQELIPLRALYPLDSHWFDPQAVNVLGTGRVVVGGAGALQIDYESQVHHGQPWRHISYLFLPDPRNPPPILLVMHSSIFNPAGQMPYVQAAMAKNVAVLVIASGNPGEGYYGISGRNYATQIIQFLNQVYAYTRDPRDLPHLLMANVGIKGIAAAEQVLGLPFNEILGLGCSKYSVSAMIAAGIHPRTTGVYSLCYDNGYAEWAADFYYERTNGGILKIKDFGDPILEEQYALIYDPWEFREELEGVQHVYASGSNDPTRPGIWGSEGYFQKMIEQGYQIRRFFRPNGGHMPGDTTFYKAYVMGLDELLDQRPLPTFSQVSERRVGSELEVMMDIQNVPPNADVRVVQASDPAGLYDNQTTVWTEHDAYLKNGHYFVSFPAPFDEYVWYFFQVEDRQRTAISSQAFEKPIWQ